MAVRAIESKVMTPSLEHDRRVMTILATALHLSESERSGYLHVACQGNEELIQEIADAVEWEERMGNFLRDPLVSLQGLERPFQAGAVIAERFEIIREIGEGGMGVVYEAFDRKRNQRIAIKSAKLGFRRLLTPELESALKVRHTNICLVNEIHSAATEYGEVDFLTMELLDGQTLSARLSSSGALQYDEALDIARQLCSALNEAHLSGVIHRDLKSANIILCHSGDGTRAVITDFGLATETTLDPRDFAGTPGYMAPELWRGDRPSTASDIYALGVILYEMVTGVKPFTDQKTESRLTSLPATPSALTKGLDSRWDAAVLRCLDPSSAARPKDAKQVLALLERQPLPPLIDKLTAAWTPANVTTRRVRRIVSVLVMAILAVSAVTLARLFTVVPRSAGPKLTDKDTILLTDFRNTTGDAVFDDTLNQALAVDLEQSPFLNVFSEQRAQRTLRLMGKSPDTRVTQEIGREMCEREGIKALLMGSITSLSTQYVITLDAVNSRTGDSLARAQAQAASKEQVLKALGIAASEIRGKLGESLATVQKFDKPIEEVTTSSLDALKAYSLGMQKRRQGDDLGGVALLKHAIELDPNFAMAYARTALGYADLGDQASGEEYIRKAYERVDRVSERERYYILTLYGMLLTGNSNKTIETYQLWIQNYPRDAHALVNLGVLYFFMGQFDKSLEYVKRSHEVDPGAIYTWVNLIRGYTALNRFDEARETARQAIAHGFDVPEIHGLLMDLAVAENDAAGYNRESDWLSRQSSQETVGAQTSFIEYAAALGQLQHSEEEARKAAEHAKSSGLPGAAAQILADAAVWQAMAGRADRARKLASIAIQTSSDQNTSASAALAYGYSGDLRQSRALLDPMIKKYPENTVLRKVYQPQIDALGALQSHDAATAVAALEGQRSYDFVWNFTLPYTRGLARLAAGQGPQAAAEFQKIIDHPGVQPASPVHSLARLGLARAYALAGDNRARLRYLDFLKLWKEADPDVGILRRAKAEYEKLGYLPLYDDFKKGFIDQKKWGFFFNTCSGCVREVRDGHLRLMARAFGPANSDSGVSNFTTGEGLTIDRASIDMIQYRFAVKSFSSKGCPTNPAAPNPNLTFQGHFFNSGTWDEFDDMTAYLVVTHQPNDAPTSLHVNGFLQIHGRFFSHVDLGTLEVGETAVASIRWDRESKVFVVQVARTHTAPSVVEQTMPYTQRDDTPAANPYKQFFSGAFVPNCTSAKSFATIDSRIEWVRVSHSATN